MKLWTFGYAGKRVEDLVASLDRMPNAWLIDVRFVPRSRVTEWSGAALRQRIGDRYLHVRHFGNVNYKSNGPIVLDNPESGLASIVRVAERTALMGELALVLLCACANRSNCHRDAVARLVAARLRADDLGELLTARANPEQGSLF